MRLAVSRLVSACALAVLASPAQGQTTITGANLVLNSANGLPNAQILSSTGYVGTFINVPDSGNGGSTVDFALNAALGSGSGVGPHMNLVVADTKYGFTVNNTLATDYSTSMWLPAGTHVVRAERDYIPSTSPAASNRAATVNSLTVTGATVPLQAPVDPNHPDIFEYIEAMNGHSLDSADTYIQNFRKTTATIKLQGIAPGTPVTIDQTRHAFDFGTAVSGGNGGFGNVSAYLGLNSPTPTAQQTNFQAKLNQNFNALVPENAGKWQPSENTRDTVTMSGVDSILNYAQDPDRDPATDDAMNVRMHNMIWGDQQPGYINTMLGNPTGTDSQTGQTNALGVWGAVNGSGQHISEIGERIGYYVGTGTASDRSLKYTAIDVYNESRLTGEGRANSYWNTYGPEGIAEIYREVQDRIAAAGGNAKVFVNEYNVLTGQNWYLPHIEELRNAGLEAGLGDVVEGVGSQYYPDTFGSHVPVQILMTMHQLSGEGLPFTLTEFGISTGVSAANAAQILEETVRLTFGNADATGFYMWGFVRQNGGGLFRPAGALFDVNTSNWNNWTITDAGKAWQDMLGIQDWDGDTTNGWNSDQSVTVNANGEIEFNGFYGDYKLTINGQDYLLSLEKGQATAFLLPINPGDFDFDGDVDADDIDLLFANQGANSLYDLDGDDDADHADVNELVNDILGTTFGDADLDGDVDGADFDAWRIRDSLGEPIGWTTGDWDGDGDVDGGDFDLWRERPASIPGGSLAAVPEPTTIVLMVLALPMLINLERSRFRRTRCR